MKLTIFTAAMLLAAPAFAQTSAPMTTTAPNATVPTVVSPGGPEVANSGPGATGTIRTEGTAAGNITNNPAGAGNASQPSRAGSTQSGQQ